MSLFTVLAHFSWLGGISIFGNRNLRDVVAESFGTGSRDFITGFLQSVFGPWGWLDRCHPWLWARRGRRIRFFSGRARCRARRPLDFTVSYILKAPVRIKILHTCRLRRWACFAGRHRVIVVVHLAGVDALAIALTLSLREGSRLALLVQFCAEF